MSTKWPAKSIIKEAKIAAKAMKIKQRRIYQADFAKRYFGGSARKTEVIMWRSRESIQHWLDEMNTGVIYKDGRKNSWQRKREDKILTLKDDIVKITEWHISADPKFQNEKKYLNVTAKYVREQLVVKWYLWENLPSERSIGDMLNRMWYRLKSVQKTKPLKKIPETDAIFEKVDEEKKNRTRM